MQKNLIPLSSNEHRTHGWKQPDSLEIAANHSCSLVLLAELPFLLQSFSLAFAKITETAYQLVALHGLHKNENLFVNLQGKWLVDCLPSFYRGYPFHLHQVNKGKERQGVLCFDQDSGLYRKEPDLQAGEQRFYTDDGQLQLHMQQLINFLGTCAVNQKMTRTAVDALEDSGLIVPWTFNITNPDVERPLLDSFCRIDENKLQDLDSATLKHLQTKNALPLAYMQLSSMPRINYMLKLYKQKYATSSMLNTTADVGRLVGDISEEPMKFNWNNLE